MKDIILPIRCSTVDKLKHGLWLFSSWTVLITAPASLLIICLGIFPFGNLLNVGYDLPMERVKSAWMYALFLVYGLAGSGLGWTFKIMSYAENHTLPSIRCKCDDKPDGNTVTDA